MAAQADACCAARDRSRGEPVARDARARAQLALARHDTRDSARGRLDRAGSALARRVRRSSRADARALRRQAVARTREHRARHRSHCRRAARTHVARAHARQYACDRRCECAVRHPAPRVSPAARERRAGRCAAACRCVGRDEARAARRLRRSVVDVRRGNARARQRPRPNTWPSSSTPKACCAFSRCAERRDDARLSARVAHAVRARRIARRAARRTPAARSRTGCACSAAASCSARC